LQKIETSSKESEKYLLLSWKLNNQQFEWHFMFVINNKICCYYSVICNLFFSLTLTLSVCLCSVRFQSKISREFSMERAETTILVKFSCVFLLICCFILQFQFQKHPNIQRRILWCLLLTSWTTTIASTFFVYFLFSYFHVFSRQKRDLQYWDGERCREKLTQIHPSNHKCVFNIFFRNASYFQLKLIQKEK
jgi:amino acid transporter